MTTTRTRKQATPADTTPAAKVAEAPAVSRETPAPAPKPNPCSCGCGQATRRPTAKYVAGHDARHAGEVGRSSRSDDEVRELFANQPKLMAKAMGVRETARRKVAEKAAAKALREELAAKLAEVKAAHASK